MRNVFPGIRIMSPPLPFSLSLFLFGGESSFIDNQEVTERGREGGRERGRERKREEGTRFIEYQETHSRERERERERGEGRGGGGWV
jgi:hypothetical protein